MVLFRETVSTHRFVEEEIEGLDIEATWGLHSAACVFQCRHYPCVCVCVCVCVWRQELHVFLWAESISSSLSLWDHPGKLPLVWPNCVHEETTGGLYPPLLLLLLFSSSSFSLLLSATLLFCLHSSYLSPLSSFSSLPPILVCYTLLSSFVDLLSFSIPRLFSFHRFSFFFPGELSSRLLSSFLFSLLPSSLFGSRVFYIPHTLPPLFNCLVIISLLLTSSTSFSPLFSTLLFSHFFPSSQLALPRSFSEPLSSFSFLSPLLRNVVQFQTDLNTFQIFGCFFVFCF